MDQEFEFLDDGSEDGQFVRAGNVAGNVSGLIRSGAIDEAVRIYEDANGAARQTLLDEVKFGSFELKKQIAMVLRRARDFSAAAKAYQFAKIDAEAAPCFEQAGEFANAAACYQRLGELVKAGAAYERAGNLDEAAALYKKADAKDSLAECLVRQQKFAEAAAIFKELNNAHAEVETLRSGLQAFPGHPVLVMRLAELMTQHGQMPKAVELLFNAVKTNPAARDDRRVLEYTARLLDATGNGPTAEKVRARIAALPAVAPGAPPAANMPAIAQNAKPQPATAEGYGFLKALPMFAELSLDDMKALYRISAQVSFTPGQHVIEAGMAGRGLFVLIDGQVEVYGGSDANARLLNTLGVGGYVGEISLVRDGPTSARVTARTPVKALFISRTAFTQFLFGQPSAALCIYRLFTQNLAERVRVLSAAR